MQIGTLVTVFSYMVVHQPWMAALSLILFSVQAFFIPRLQRASNRRAASRIQVMVGTVVAFISGLKQINDPWGDLVDYFREMTVTQVKYRLIADILGGPMPHAAYVAVAGPPHGNSVSTLAS